MRLSTFDDPVLREEMSRVEEIDDEVRELVDNMIESMYCYNGVGLAAPQVGIAKQITVMDCGEERDGSDVVAMINPEILETEGEQSGEEGCLSLPGIWEDPGRQEYAKVQFLTPEGEEKTIGREGLWGRCIQHEVDHLRGTLFIDHLEGETAERVDSKFDVLAQWSKDPGVRIQEGASLDQFLEGEGKFADAHHEIMDKITVPQAFRSDFQSLEGGYTGAILTEVDRFESAFVLPIVVKMFEEIPDASYRILSLESHQPIFDFYRSYGIPAPPVVALFNEEMMEIGVWGPRSEKAEKHFRDFPEGMSGSEQKDAMESYYLEDGPSDVYEEFLEIFEQIE